MESVKLSADQEEEKELVEAVCWECGEKKMCLEIVVCCTGTLLHVCPECYTKDQSPDPDDCPAECD